MPTAGLCFLVLLAGPSANAASASPAAEYWRGLTGTDVESAYALLKDNHPGAASEAGDPAFMPRLEAGRTKALARAAEVGT